MNDKSIIIGGNVSQSNINIGDHATLENVNTPEETGKSIEKLIESALNYEGFDSTTKKELLNQLYELKEQTKLEKPNMSFIKRLYKSISSTYTAVEELSMIWAKWGVPIQRQLGF